MLSKQHILDLIAEEKERYSAYTQLCAFYKIEPNSLATVKCLAKIETMEHMLKLI